MLKFLSKNYLFSGAVIVAGTTLLPLTAFAETAPVSPINEPNPPSSNSLRLSVIQGKVTSIQGNTVTVKTPDVAPYCPPGRFCPAIIIVGPTFKVNIARATFQSPSGSPQSPKPLLKVNDSVVVVGRADVSTPVVISPQLTPNPSAPPKPFTAQIISKIVTSGPIAVP